jgi:hypothetical protein
LQWRSFVRELARKLRQRLALHVPDAGDDVRRIGHGAQDWDGSVQQLSDELRSRLTERFRGRIERSARLGLHVRGYLG